jgi:WD40 repeat protein
MRRLVMRWFVTRRCLVNRTGAIALSVALWALVGVSGASAALAQGQIAFSSTRDGTENADIFVMNADGTAQTRVTSDPASDVEPTWSADGGRLAFTGISFDSQQVQPGHIYVVNVDGSGQTQLTKASNPDSYPAWSPDGSEIAFTRGRVDTLENNDVFVMDADGANQRDLSNDPAFDGFPAWSPDGAKIAFTSDRDGNPEIYTMNADGSGQTRLTDDPASDAHPAWSPDGTRIAFVSDRDGTFQLYTMSATGGGERRLTSGKDQPGIPLGDYAPTWSPDATTIAYTADQGDGVGIGLISADGGPTTLLPALGFGPSWGRSPVDGVLLSDDFESGDLSKWSGGSGMSVQTQIVSSGTYAARATATGSPAFAYKTLATGQDELYYRLRFNVQGQGATSMYLLRLRSTPNNPIMGLFVSPTGVLCYRNQLAGGNICSAYSPTRAAWHTALVHVVVSGAASTVEVWLDGTELMGATDDLGTADVGRIELGDMAGAKTFDVALDDVVVSTSPLSPSAPSRESAAAR